jgi:glutamate 5-kinase
MTMAHLVAQAISEYGSDEIKKIMGKHSSSIISSTGVYRGDMIVRNQSVIWT